MRWILKLQNFERVRGVRLGFFFTVKNRLLIFLPPHFQIDNQSQMSDDVEELSHGLADLSTYPRKL